MNYIKRKRSFHPLVSVLYVMLYTGVIGYAFSQQNYTTEFQVSFILQPVFQNGIQIPVFASIIIMVGALVTTGYLMHEILVKRFDISRKMNLHFFIIPLLILPAQNILEMTIISLFMLITSLTLSYILSMATIEIDIKKIFFAGFLAGNLFLINGAVAVFLILFPMLLFSNRLFTVRAVLVYGIAFILPLSYYLTYLYLIDFNQWALFLEGNSFHLFAFENVFNYLNHFVLAFFALLISFLVFRVHIRLSEFKIAIRRAYLSTLFCLLVFLLSIVLMPSAYMPIFLAGLIFIALFYYLQMVVSVKRKIWMAFLYVLPALIYSLNYYFTSGYS